MSKINKFINRYKIASRNPLIRFLLIPVFLLFLWVFLSYLLNPRTPFSLISYNHDSTQITNLHYNPIYAHDVIEAEFQGKEDNLGIVAIRFNTYQRINSDSIIFRIREKGAKKWVYENSYKVDQFQPDDYFTFGFPIFQTSKGKTFEFQLESQKGKSKDAVSLSRLEPIFVTKYKFDKEYILGVHFPEFFFNKLVHSFSSPDFIQLIPKYLFPFIFYCTWLFYQQKKVKSSLAFSLLVPVVFLVYIFFNDVFELEELLYMLLWMVPVLVYRLDSSITFFFSFVYLFVALLLAVGDYQLALQAGLWSFIFLVFASVQSLAQNLSHRQNIIGIKKYLDRIVFERK